MQYSKVSSKLIRGIQLIFTLVLWVWLYFLLREHAFFEHDFLTCSLFSSPFFILVCLLMPINWGLESLKWAILTQKDYQLAYYQVLQGLVFQFFLPFGLGEYLGRKGKEPLRKHTKRYAIHSISASLVTLFAALLSAVSWYAGITEVFVFLLLSLCIVVFVLRKRRRKDFFILGLSSLRYLIFLLQFLLLLYFFGGSALKIEHVYAATWMWATKLLLPFVGGLGDLGLRELGVAWAFPFLKLPLDVGLRASLLLWGLNLFLPAFVGLFWMSTTFVRLKKKV